MRLFACSLALGFLAGCASLPATPIAAPAPVLPPRAVQPVATSASAEEKVAAPAGYKAVERDGVTYFCTSVARIGTKFKRDVCLTQDDYEELERRSVSFRRDMQKNAAVCGGITGPGACGGGG